MAARADSPAAVKLEFLLLQGAVLAEAGAAKPGGVPSYQGLRKSFSVYSSTTQFFT